MIFTKTEVSHLLPRQLRRWAKRIVMLACLLLLAGSVGATTLLYQNFDNLVSKAETIVIGTVQKTESHNGSGKKIFTFLTLTDIEVILGNNYKKTLVLRLNGGEVDGNKMTVTGSPIFRSNDRVLLFLRGNGKNVVPVVGWTQGVFRIKNDPVTQQDIVTDHEGNRIFGMKENDLIKEHKQHNEGANILGEVSPSNTTAISPGVNEDGSIPTVKGQEAAVNESQPISKEEFIGIIRQRAVQKQKPSLTVETVEIPEVSTEPPSQQ